MMTQARMGLIGLLSQCKTELMMKRLLIQTQWILQLKSSNLRTKIQIDEIKCEIASEKLKLLLLNRRFTLCKMNLKRNFI